MGVWVYGNKVFPSGPVMSFCGKPLPKLPMGVIAWIALNEVTFEYEVHLETVRGEVKLVEYQRDFPSDHLLAKIMLVAG